ncbi:hypothetical protein FBU30_009478 [Linnemannia zychae]|nr:hypothetical protein FBU30_009478 [Linnemannia zychae]
MAQNSIVSTAAPADARTRTKWYILGGTTSLVDGAPSSSQFISIDLSVPWNTSTPMWTSLTTHGTPSQALFPAVFSVDENLMYVYHLPGDSRVGQYNVLKDTWELSGMSFAEYKVQGVGAISDPTTGYIYLTGGYTDASVNNVEVYHPSRPGTVTQIPYPVTGFVSRWYVDNVYCKPRGSILYFGGYTLKSELISDTRAAAGGSVPANRANHCMAVSDDGSKVVVYGGRTSLASTVLSGDIYILDTKTLEWTQGVSGEARDIACTIAGNQLIVWGGKTAASTKGAQEPISIAFGVLLWRRRKHGQIKQRRPFLVKPSKSSMLSSDSEETQRLDSYQGDEDQTSTHSKNIDHIAPKSSNGP